MHNVDIHPVAKPHSQSLVVPYEHVYVCLPLPSQPTHRCVHAMYTNVHIHVAKPQTVRVATFRGQCLFEEIQYTVLHTQLPIHLTLLLTYPQTQAYYTHTQNHTYIAHSPTVVTFIPPTYVVTFVPQTYVVTFVPQTYEVTFIPQTYTVTVSPMFMQSKLYRTFSNSSWVAL